jgi:outer membrane protein
MKQLATILTTSLITLSFALTQNASANSKLVDDSPHFGETGWEASVGAGFFGASDNLTIYKRDDDDYKDGIFIPIDASYIGEQFYFKAEVREGLILGYTLIRNQNWAIDALLSPRFLGTIDNDLLEDLDDRDPDLHLGLRYSSYFDDSLIRLDVSQDISDRDNGFTIGASYDKEWQLKNWIVTGTVTITYISEDVTDYYYGVDNDEATNQFPVYRGDASLISAVAIDAEYPLAENWTFNANLAYFMLGDEIKDSPITIDEDSISIVSSSLRYHF